MAEALSTVFNFPSNQGAATIIRDAGPGFLDVLTKTALTQKALKAKQADTSSKALKDVKLKESWRMFSPAIENQYTGLLGKTAEKIQSGRFSQAELSADVNRINRLADSSMQLKEEVEKIDADYTKNKFINEGLAGQEMTKRLIGDQSVEALEKAALGTVNRDFFLREMGGSKYLNENEVVNTLLKESLPDWQTTKAKEIGDARGIATGLLEYRGGETTTKLKSFLREDENGNIKVVEPEKLRDAGISELFLSNPYASRIVKDRAMKLAKSEGRKEYSDDDIDKSVYSLLKGREAGEISRKESVQTARSYVESGADAANALARFLTGKLPSLAERSAMAEAVGPPELGQGPPMVPVTGTDAAFIGRKKGDVTLGNVIRGVSGEPLIETFTKRWDPMEGRMVEVRDVIPLNFSVIENFWPTSVSAKVFSQLKKQGMVDEAGVIKSNKTLLDLGKGEKRGFTGFMTTE